VRVHHKHHHWRRIAGGCALIAAMAPALSAAPAGAATVDGSAYSLLATHAARAQAAAVPDTVWGGVTDQEWPVMFVIRNGAKRLRAGLIALEMSCTSGATFMGRDAVVNLPIGKTGKVSGSRSIAPVSEAGISLTGGSHSLAATVNRRSLTISGTWRLHLDFQLSNGQPDHCDSGAVRFFARL
jgi:hypothetical protein